MCCIKCPRLRCVVRIGSIRAKDSSVTPFTNSICSRSTSAHFNRTEAISQYAFGSNVTPIRSHNSVTNSEVSADSFQIVSQPHSPLTMCTSVSRTEAKLPPKSRVNCSPLNVEAACRTLWFAQRSYSKSSWISSLFIVIADLPCARSYLAGRVRRALCFTYRHHASRTRHRTPPLRLLYLPNFVRSPANLPSQPTPTS